MIGDSDFAANGTLGVPGNRDLFMNTIGWLSQQDNLISIRPKEADDRRHHADRDAGVEHLLAVAADHSGLHLRRRRLQPGGGGDARCAD